MRFTVRMALAEHWMADFAEVEDYRYQSGRTPCPIYTSGNDYYTATSGFRHPRTNDEYRAWVRVPSDVTARFGWHIWKLNLFV